MCITSIKTFYSPCANSGWIYTKCQFDTVVRIVCVVMLDNPEVGNEKARDHQRLKLTPLYKSMSFFFRFVPSARVIPRVWFCANSEAPNKEFLF